MSGNSTFALCLSFAGGLATVISGCIPFFVDIKNKKWLALSLAFSAGVMIFISLAEVLQESIEKFEEEFEGDKMKSKLYGCLSFFGGMALCGVVDWMAHFISERFGDGSGPHGHADEILDLEAKVAKEKQLQTVDARKNISTVSVTDGCDGCWCDRGYGGICEGPEGDHKLCNVTVSIPDTAEKYSSELSDKKKSAATLSRLSVVSAVVIALHNLPEGLTTFVCGLERASLGIALTIAIALHKFPEGVCVSFPVYYATGSKLRAMAFVAVAAILQPLGSVLAFIILKCTTSDDVLPTMAFGIIFGIVGGMMAFVSFAELLPTAWRYGSEGKQVGQENVGMLVAATVMGMLVMAVSIILFEV